MLERRTQPTTIYKVKAHAKIDENEQANQLAKKNTKKKHRFASKSCAFAYTTPYYFRKTHGLVQESNITKALSNVLKHTSPKMTVKTS